MALSRLRRFLYITLQGNIRGSSGLGKVITFFLITLIFLSVVCVILQSVPSFEARFHRAFYYFEVVALTIFSLEYVLRLFAAKDDPRFGGHPIWARLRWAVSPMALVDLVAIVPSIILALGVDFVVLRVFRLLRVLKLTRYSPAFHALQRAFHYEAKILFSTFFIMFLLVVIVSTLVYVFEHPAQPDAFPNIPMAMYWALITLTTVGYGDITPVTMMGRLLAAVLGVLGVMMVALPAGILASAFSEQMRQRRHEYEQLVSHAIRDGRLSAEEYESLAKMQKILGLNEEQAARIIEVAVRSHGEIECPHCGELILFPSHHGKPRKPTDLKT